MIIYIVILIAAFSKIPVEILIGLTVAGGIASATLDHMDSLERDPELPNKWKMLLGSKNAVQSRYIAAGAMIIVAYASIGGYFAWSFRGTAMFPFLACLLVYMVVDLFFSLVLTILRFRIALR